ncbi:MAG: oligogalacturonate lyase family protein [Acidobacteriia bacterium]|nr:oligogalacturonate lyase family protein [Terriglobia bacterium]
MKSLAVRIILSAAVALGTLPLHPQDTAEPPKAWIDPDTGHRIVRLTAEPGSASLYFNQNGYTADGMEMVYTTPDGISVLDLKTHAARQVVKGRVRVIVTGRRTQNVYYLRGDRVCSTDVDTGATREIATLPPQSTVATVNADETLLAGTYTEGNSQAPYTSGGQQPQTLVQPQNKGQMMEQRLAARIPMGLFTVNVKNGEVKTIHKSTDWLNHLEFSPTDPTLLMFCHEGPWHKVDRIWTIRTDGTHNQLIHKRTMENEIAGHEWWGADGETVFYQLHFPRGGRVSFIASYNVKTGERVWLQYDARDQSSIHDNSSPDSKLYVGDGDNRDPWIILLRPVLVPDRRTLGKNLIQGGYLVTERLVNMSKHNYRLEPNPCFTPDMKYIVFRSNMFGPDYAFAVEIAKANPSP